jgi:hypothetical protein
MGCAVKKPEDERNAGEMLDSIAGREKPPSLIEGQLAASDSDRRTKGLDCRRPRRWRMGTARLNWLLLPIGIMAAFVMVVSLVGASFADEGTEERVQMTDHYRVAIELGPMTSIMTADQAAGAKEGHVVVNTQGIPMDLRDLMPMTDQGQAVNRLLEVFIYNRETGTLITNVVPRVSITDQISESSRNLPPLAKMYHAQDGPNISCFGTSAFLDGTYRLSVKVEDEEAVFEDIAVSGPAPPPSSSADASGTTGN